MRKTLIFLILVIFFFSLVSSADKVKVDSAIATQLNEYETVPVIITFNEDVSDLNFSAILNDSFEEEIKEILPDTISTTIDERALTELSDNEQIKSISYDYPLKLFMEDSVKIISANTTWIHQVNGINLTGAGQTVCIIDTGINYSHQDFGSCSTEEFTSGTCNKVIWGYDYGDGDTDPMDNNGHGSHVAGTVAGNGLTIGVAPNAKIVAMKVFSDSGTGSESDVISAILDCTANSEKYNISVITMSLGLEDEFEHEIIESNYCDGDSDYEELKDAIDAAIAKNISVSVATGNAYSSSGVGVPACFANVTRVGSTPKTDNTISSFTNLGIHFLDILLAPGEDILSTAYNGTQVFYSGTSMATPHVAGAIALIREYKKLESDKILNSSYLKSVLNNTGKAIARSGVGTFSRINVFAAILSADEKAPEVTYMFPENNTNTYQNNQTFFCNVSDYLQVSNLTLKVYNSTSVIFNQTLLDNQTYDTLSKNLILNSYGTYNFLCNAKDGNNNQIIQNNILNVSQFATVIVSPGNNTFSNSNSTTFVCSAGSGSNNLTNISLYISQGTNSVLNQVQNINTNETLAVFYYNFTEDNTYTYYCNSFNNNSANTTTLNYTFTYDATLPLIALISPDDGSSTTSKTITFDYTQTETNSDGCYLTINGDEYTDFTQTLSDGTYLWYVTCIDKAGNSGTSGTRTLTISASAEEEESDEEDDNNNHHSSGGGGSTTSSGIYTISNSNLESGYSKALKTGNILKFNIRNTTHQLKLTSIWSDGVSITVSSTPKNLLLPLNQEKSVDIDDDGTSDIKLILLGVNSTSANIFIQKINEAEQLEEANKNYNLILSDNSSSASEENKTNPSALSNFISRYKYYLIGLILIVIAYYFVSAKYKRKKRK